MKAPLPQENPVENPPAPVEIGDLRVPSHGGGLILYGSKPGDACPAKGHGRPPNAFKQLMAELANLPEAEAILRAILRGEQVIRLPSGVMAVDGRLWLDTYKYVTERAYGKAVSEAEMTPSEGERKPFIVRFIKVVQERTG